MENNTNNTITKGKLKKRGGKKFIHTLIAIISLSSIVLAGCNQATNERTKEEAKKEKVEEKLTGEVKADGSSTVFPIAEAVAEEFQRENPDVRVTVGVSGTGGGFEKFANGEIDIANASRAIKDEEKEACQKNNIEFIELKVAFDGITVVVNKENNWCNDITVDELKKIWEPGSKVKKWSDIRKGWPNEKIVLFGPDTDSGTFDFFTKEIMGEEKKSRSDYTPSADDNVLVEGVAGEKFSLGYFGFAYYEENKDKLNAVKINGVQPSLETIRDGSYEPLSRPLYIYVNKASLKKPQVYGFIKFFLENGLPLVEDAGFVPLPSPDDYTQQLSIVDEASK